MSIELYKSTDFSLNLSVSMSLAVFSEVKIFVKISVCVLGLNFVGSDDFLRVGKRDVVVFDIQPTKHHFFDH